MTNIFASDIIFANVYRFGREVASLRMTGMNSEAEIMAAVCGSVAGGGVLDLVLRNGTQGWCERRCVRV